MRTPDRDERIWLLEKWQKEGRFLKGPPGMTAQWTPEEGAHLRSYRQSTIGRPGRNELLDPGIGDPTTRFSVPALRRRSFEERVESLVQRLMDTPPALQEELYRDITSEYWKQGAPVTVDQLRRLATDIMNRADKRLTVSNRTGG